MKRIISILLAAALIAGTFVFVANAYDEPEGIAYEETEDALTAPAADTEDAADTENAAAVANIYLCTNASGLPSLGHVWVYFENLTNHDITVGIYTCHKREGVSVGAFGVTRSDGAGVYYNIEAYCGNKFPEQLKKYVTKKTTVSQEELDDISNFIKYHNFWDPVVFNCIFFAATCWNKAGGQFNFPFKVLPIFERWGLNAMGPDETPVQMFDPGRERVYKQRGSGDDAMLEIVSDGSVDTVPG